ncbi:MAG: hypothetical protein ACP6IY_14810 [Promethearchaeia archaeon]
MSNRDLTKTVIMFNSRVGSDNNVIIDKLIYDPSLYNYFKKNKINLAEILADTLIDTKFNEKLSKRQLLDMISKLDFSKKIIFDYHTKKIEID